MMIRLLLQQYLQVPEDQFQVSSSSQAWERRFHPTLCVYMPLSLPDCTDLPCIHEVPSSFPLWIYLRDRNRIFPAAVCRISRRGIRILPLLRDLRPGTEENRLF